MKKLLIMTVAYNEEKKISDVLEGIEKAVENLHNPNPNLNLDYTRMAKFKFRLYSDGQHNPKYIPKAKHMDFSKAVRDLKHDPKVTPEEGIKRTVEWMKSIYTNINI